MDLFLFRTSIDLLVITRKNEVLKFPDVRVLLFGPTDPAAGSRALRFQ